MAMRSERNWMTILYRMLIRFLKLGSAATYQDFKHPKCLISSNSSYECAARVRRRHTNSPKSGAELARAQRQLRKRLRMRTRDYKRLRHDGPFCGCREPPALPPCP